MPISVFTQTQVTRDNHHYEGYTFMGKHPFGCPKMVTYQALDLTSIFHGCDAILSAISSELMPMWWVLPWLQFFS